VSLKTSEKSRLRVVDDITQLVGETPMLQLKRLVPPGSADVFAKLEYLNPGGSVKDRAAIGIIRRAEQEGKLVPGGTIVEATAGNTGIGLALIGVNRGYKVSLFVPENFSQEKVTIMRALGAEVVRTPDAEGMQGAINQAKALVASNPKAFMAGQFENLANPDYHYETTAREMFDQLEGQADAVVLGCGTCGTFSGVARYFKEKLPHVLAFAVETQGSILKGGQPGHGQNPGSPGRRAGRIERRRCGVCLATGRKETGSGEESRYHHPRLGRTLSLQEDFRRRPVSR
jgi:cysteine synthase A